MYLYLGVKKPLKVLHNKRVDFFSDFACTPILTYNEYF